MTVRRWRYTERYHKIVKAETGWEAARQGPSKIADKLLEARKRQARIHLSSAGFRGRAALPAP